ncbi:hypothetical protein [Nocardia sp. NPDC051832]|uniref:hypothetical protein n=1 Tax=Nocardia sp. NPDC051832 TaxID=3155673 RepID=UPI00343C9E96
MAGWALTRTNVTSWNAEKLGELAGAVETQNGNYKHQVDRAPQQFANLAGVWSGMAHDAAYSRVSEDNKQSLKIKDEVTDLVTLLREASSRLVSERNSLLGKVSDAEDPTKAVAGEVIKVSDVWALQTTLPANVTDEQRTKIVERVNGQQGLINTAFYSLRDAAKQFDQAIRTAAQQIRDTGNNFGDARDAPVSPGTPVAAPDSTDPRTTASAAAFEKMFGRPPVSDVDWKTAAALNPNSYDPKYQGHPPNIKVAKIEPVPGQGVVRAAAYIPAEEVFNVPANDLGDDRGNNPNFDPEHARVVSYIDYENGLIITRQNPSVTTDGEVKCGEPEVKVTQLSNGAVMLQYDAANPFAPPGANLSGHTVNGTLVVEPTSGNPGTPRVTAGGEITNYPSMEIYQDNSAGNGRPVLIDAADSGSKWGPMANLPSFHEVGGGKNMFEPFKVNFNDPNWERYAPTPLGDTNNPPKVVVR